jgi:hypothetical protein
LKQLVASFIWTLKAVLKLGTAVSYAADALLKSETGEEGALRNDKFGLSKDMLHSL